MSMDYLRLIFSNMPNQGISHCNDEKWNLKIQQRISFQVR